MDRCCRGSSFGNGNDSGGFILRLFSLKSGAVLLHDLIVTGLITMGSACSARGGSALPPRLCKAVLAPSVGLDAARGAGSRPRLHLGCREINFMLCCNLLEHDRTRRMP